MSELFQGDLDLGRRAVELLRQDGLGPHVTIEDLHYGAVAVAQRLEEVRPDALVLVGAAVRHRPPGTVERRRLRPPDRTPTEVQAAVQDAVTGYVTIDLLVDVCAGLVGLPDRTIAIEVEPALTGPSDRLSAEGTAALPQAVQLVRAEVARIPMLGLADELRELCADDRLEAAPAVDTVRALLDQLRVLDEEGRWGATFATRDHLLQLLAQGRTGAGMNSLDWALWWELIEELDRLRTVEVARD